MPRLLLVVVLALAWPASAQVVFEPEESVPSAPVVPPPPPAPTWSPPQLDLRLVTRLSVDLASDHPGENLAELYRFLTVGIRTERGNLRFQLSARLRWATYEEAPSSGAFLLYNGTNWHSDFDVTLGESYVSYTRWGIDWTAGTLDIAWGQNPAFSPADVLTPLDLRDGPFVTPDARIPVPAVRVRGHFSWLNWDAVWIPVWIASRMPLFGNDWSPFAVARSPVIPDLSRYLDPSLYGTFESNPIATKQPALDLSAPQGGLRLSTRAGPLNVAVSWAEFFDRQPQLHYSSAFEQLVQAATANNLVGVLTAETQLASTSAAPFTATYLHTRVFAFDAALLTGRLRWTLDAGYSPLRVFPLQDLSSTTKPMLSGVLGVEFEGPPIIAAGVYSVLALNVDPGVRLLYLESDSSLATAQRNVSLTLGYLTISEDFLDGRLQLALNAVVTQHSDFFLTPTVRWRIRDAHNLALGANIIEGPGGSIGAAYQHNNEAFFEYVLRL